MVVVLRASCGLDFVVDVMVAELVVLVEDESIGVAGVLALPEDPTTFQPAPAATLIGETTLLARLA